MMFLDRRYLCLVVQPVSLEEKMDWRDTDKGDTKETGLHLRCNSASVHQRSVVASLVQQLQLLRASAHRKTFCVSCCSEIYDVSK